MIRNKQHRRIGSTKARLPQLGSQRRGTVTDTAGRRFSRQRSSENINAIPAKVLAYTVDHGLIAAGVAAAIGSATFATIMISQNSLPEMLKGTEYPEVFERSFRARPHRSEVHATNSNGRPIDYRTIDYNVTGSISKGDSGKAAQITPPTFNNDVSAVSASDSTNNTYVLRFVHKEAALLQSNRGFYVARRGTMLPGAGKVLSITRYCDKWILVTAKKTFAEARNNLP
jgi:hypothetical protein